MRCHISDISIKDTTSHFPVDDFVYLTVESGVYAGKRGITISTVCIRSWSWIRWCEVTCSLLAIVVSVLEGDDNILLTSERRRLTPEERESLVFVVDGKGVAVAAKDIFRSISFFGIAMEGLRMISGDGR